MKTEYVLTFAFDKRLESVWLIEKQKPEWQKGCLNGIGGKIEEGESPMEAAIRELKEESGLEVDVLIPVGEMSGTNNDGSSFAVFFFTCITSNMAKTMETEKIGEYSTFRMEMYKTIGNVPLLIEACKYRLKGSSNFQYLKMQY